MLKISKPSYFLEHRTITRKAEKKGGLTYECCRPNESVKKVENARGSSASNREGRLPPVDAGEEGSSSDETSPSGKGDRGEVVLLPAPTAANANPRLPLNATEVCGIFQRTTAPAGPVHEASVDDNVEALAAATLE